MRVYAHAQGVFKLPVDEAGAVLGIAKEVLDSWFATYMQVCAPCRTYHALVCMLLCYA